MHFVTYFVEQLNLDPAAVRLIEVFTTVICVHQHSRVYLMMIEHRL